MRRPTHRAPQRGCSMTLASFTTAFRCNQLPTTTSFSPDELSGVNIRDAGRAFAERRLHEWRIAQSGNGERREHVALIDLVGVPTMRLR